MRRVRGRIFIAMFAIGDAHREKFGLLDAGWRKEMCSPLMPHHRPAGYPNPRASGVRVEPPNGSARTARQPPLPRHCLVIFQCAVTFRDDAPDLMGEQRPGILVARLRKLPDVAGD